MPKDTITVALTGDISLADFATAIGRFRSLVDALTSEVAADAAIQWLVVGLDYGSAIATVRGVPGQTEALPKVEAVVRAYAAVGRALEIASPIPYSAKVVEPALQLRSIIGKRIQTIRFETADAEAVLSAQAAETPVTPYKELSAASGAVEGRIQTVSNRGTLRFTLYDLVEDRPISCYLREGEEDLLRNLWGRIAVVEGRVKREPIDGRPVSIRDISAVIPRPEPLLGSFRRARGVLPWSPGDPLPEDLIRRTRDA